MSKFIKYRASHTLRYFAFVVVGALWFGCSNEQILNSSDEALSLTPVIDLEITGGFAGVNRNLEIFQDGRVEYQSLRLNQGAFNDVISQEKLAELKQLAVDNNFFRSEKQYFLDQAADLFVYKLNIVQDDLENTVELNYEAAPLELREVIDALSDILQEVAEHTLNLAVSLSADTLEAGDSLTVNLSVENASEEALELLFKSGQIYDFFITDGSDGASFPSNEQATVWTWSANKLFTQAAHTISLDAGESKSYSIEWDGANLSGERLQGDFWVGARLVSTPGGVSPLVKVHVR